MSDFMRSPRVLQKIEADQRKVRTTDCTHNAQMLAARKATSSTMSARDYANNAMIKNNQALQSVVGSVLVDIQEYMKKQDQSLEILADGVDRLDNMAKGIGDEIRQQDAQGDDVDVMMLSLLDTLDTDVSDAQTRLGQAREKMQKLMKTNNKCEFYSIIILFIVMLIMIFSLF